MNKYIIFVSLLTLICCVFSDNANENHFKVKSETAFDPKVQCNHRLKDFNNDFYVNSSLRLSICQKNTPNPTKRLECYTDNFVNNPCFINCYQKTKDESDICSDVNREQRYRLVDIECGKGLYCDNDGCCDRLTDKTDTPEPIDPTISTHTESIITTTEETDPFNCPGPGNFSACQDWSSYWNCHFVEIAMECNKNEVFNQEKQECEKIDWTNYLRCERIGYFINPFDCHKYFRCFKRTEDSQDIEIAFYDCKAGMVWDISHETCVKEQAPGQCLDSHQDKSFLKELIVF